MQDIHNISRVCKQWFCTIWAFQNNISIGNIKDSLKADSAILSLSNNCPRLTTLQIGGGTDAGFKNIPRLESVESLKLYRCFDITNSSCESISKNTNLKELIISRCPQITDEGIKHLKNLSLHVLGLYGLKEITDESISELNQMETLYSLNLHGCSKITDQALIELSKVNKLKRLDVSWCVGISGSCFEFLNENLEHIDLRWNYRVVDSSLQFLGKIQTLKHLNFEGCEQISLDGISALSSLHNLEFLNLGDLRHITNECIIEISKSNYAKVLKTLILRYCELITDDCLSCFEDSLTSITYLSLQACLQITDESLKHVSKLSTLETLNLTANYYTDKGIYHLLELKKLKVLNVSQCPRITDRSLERFGIMDSLEEINLQCCKRISHSALSYFQKVVCSPSVNVII